MRTPLATAGSRGDFIEDCIARTGEICHGRSLVGVGKPTGAIGTWSGAKEKDAGASGRKLEGDGGRAGTTRRLPGPRWSFPGRAGSFDFAGLALGGGEEGERKGRFGLDFGEDRRREAREAICGGEKQNCTGKAGSCCLRRTSRGPITPLASRPCGAPREPRSGRPQESAWMRKPCGSSAA